MIARTDAEAADLLTSDYDENDKPFLTGERTAEGFYKTKKGMDQAISRAVAYAHYADLVWCETGTPDLEFARKFAEAVHKVHPGKMLAYNCSPSFNWKKNLDDATIAKFQKELGAMGYKYQFITLAGIHSMWFNMFDLAQDYVEARHVGLRREGAGARIRSARPRLHLRVAPAGSRHRLLRRSDDRDPGRQVERDGADRFDRGRAVPLIFIG